jgi:hypothetical protein
MGAVHGAVNRVVVAVTALCLAGVAAPAWAQGSRATGAGSLGAVDITVDGQVAHADPIAPCVVGTAPANQADPVTIGRNTRYGTGTTSCVATTTAPRACRCPDSSSRPPC